MSSTRATGGPSWEPFARWHDLLHRGDPRFTRVGSVDEAAEVLVRVAARTRTSMWNMQRHSSIDSLGDPYGLDAESRRKGLELRYILPRRVAEVRSPLASSYYTYLRLAPVAHPMIVSDRRQVLLGDATGESIWTSTDPGVVDAAVHLFEGLWQVAEPAVPEGQDPPFTPRMVEVAVLLVKGATDREIARALGVSQRTVSADVSEMSRRLGARTRAHAIAVISGA